MAAKITLKLASRSKLMGEDTPEHCQFKLFCDDFWPTNILVNENSENVAVIDWDFTDAGIPRLYIIKLSVNDLIKMGNALSLMRIHIKQCDLALPPFLAKVQ